ncbi:MAG: potassium-transporting ATPase subunit F [Alphaproteobacteria bacterium]|nr:MAG: potassium-transporting ATPase subunit F [Alphaproteobacteria bacterium]
MTVAYLALSLLVGGLFVYLLVALLKPEMFP